MVRRANRLRFGKDDPLLALHVPRRKRLEHDEPADPKRASDASSGGMDDTFDRDEIRNWGDVVPPEDLQ